MALESYDDGNRIPGVNGYYIFRKWSRTPDGKIIYPKKGSVLKIWVPYEEDDKG